MWYHEMVYLIPPLHPLAPLAFLSLSTHMADLSSTNSSPATKTQAKVLRARKIRAQAPNRRLKIPALHPLAVTIRPAPLLTIHRHHPHQPWLTRETNPYHRMKMVPEVQGTVPHSTHLLRALLAHCHNPRNFCLHNPGPAVLVDQAAVERPVRLHVKVRQWLQAL